MKISLQQKQIQSLNLVMTPALRQAIELLQYSTYELYDYLQEQSLANPLLELNDIHDDSFNMHETTRRRNSTGTSLTSLDWIPDNETTMRDHLLQQVNLSFHNPEDIKLLTYLINNLDDCGYLQIEVSEDEATYITHGIHLLQKIGPIGIAARNLQECLLLQLTYQFPNERLAYSLLNKHFDLLAQRKWDEIAKGLEISLDEVSNLYQFIQKLNPKPCVTTTDFKTEYTRPDIVIEKKENHLSYFLNDQYLPSIQMNNEYLAMRSQGGDLAKYINEQYDQVQWLINSIEQRRRTISKITEVILKKQKKFFDDGFIALKPLTLQEVADEISMHESTVSRATANKSIQTPNGTFELRKFFTSKLDTADGSSISQIKVKTLLTQFIEQEDKRKPFSDEKIANYFKNEKGIHISRRTISKYREELNIPSSRMRKEI